MAVRAHTKRHAAYMRPTHSPRSFRTGAPRAIGAIRSAARKRRVAPSIPLQLFDPCAAVDSSSELQHDFRLYHCLRRRRCAASISMPIGSTVAKPSVARGAIFKVTRDRGAEGVEMDLFRRVSARLGLPMIRSGTASVLGTGLNYRYPAFAALRLSTEGAHAAGRRSVHVNAKTPFCVGVY